MSPARLPQSYAGSISEGTLLTRDLLMRFMNVLQQADPSIECVREFKRVWDAATTLSTFTTLEYDTAECVLEAIGFWDSAQAQWMLNEQAFDALNEVAPEGCFFGASEGDGASFGFWWGDNAENA
jgi:hypothetical protein